jgi:molybdopterin molybdotransferase
MVTGRDWDNPEQMLGVDDALARIVAHFAPLPAVETLIVDALGMVVARDITSTVDVPPFRNSAMDGYAVRHGDTSDASATLRVVGTIAAGTAPRRAVGPGEAIRIMTGAPLPDGADAVVRFEETDEISRVAAGTRDEISVFRPVRTGENVREAGEDIRLGELVLAAGTSLGPSMTGVLASLNHSTVSVHRKPRVAILATGDEVVEPGQDLLPGQIRNSNSYMLAALVRQAGGEPLLLGIAGDTIDDLHAKLRTQQRPDLFITSGGVSAGDYDVVKDALQAGGNVEIWQVRMKPGKPLAFGTLAGTPLLGLPGNPVAALVSFEQFGRPAIRRMLGHTNPCLQEVDAIVTERLTNPGRRRHYVRGVVERSPTGLIARPIRETGSAILTAVTRANCFIVVHESKDVVEAGAVLRVQLLEGVTPI